MLRLCVVCKRPARGARCPEHAHARGYNTGHWQTVRRVRLARDNYICQLQHDDGCTQHATTVHLDPGLRGDHRRATLDNTLSACRHCHGVEDAPRASGYPGGGGVAKR